MVDEQDPFAALNNEEGMSPLAKFCIFAALIILVLAVYFNGSGKSESYKKPVLVEEIDISGLESVEISSDELEEYRESKKKAKESPDVDEMVEQAVEKVESALEEDITVDTENAVDIPTAEEQISENDKKIKEKMKEIEEHPPVTNDPEKSIPEEKKSTEPIKKTEEVKKDKSYSEMYIGNSDIRQPKASKGDWKKSLPDFSTLIDTQRISPLEHIKYIVSFNDVNGAIARSKDNGKPLYFYRRPHELKNKDAAKLSIIVYGLGLNQKNTEYATNSLPAEVSFSFSLYSSFILKQIEAARTAGHETLLDIPLQAKDYPLTDPGELGLLQENTIEDNRINLLKMLSYDIPFIGMFSINGEAFALSAPSVGLIAEEFINRGLMFYDANESSVVSEFKGMDYLKASVIIDSDMFKEEIIAAMIKAKKIAAEKGSASLAIDARLLSIYLLRDFIEKDILTDSDIELVPVSYLVLE